MEAQTDKKRCFTFFVDGKQFQVHRPKVTGARIMELAGVTPQEGLLLCLDDGSQEVVEPEDKIKLVPCPRLTRAPRFKRG